MSNPTAQRPGAGNFSTVFVGQDLYVNGSIHFAGFIDFPGSSPPTAEVQITGNDIFPVLKIPGSVALPGLLYGYFVLSGSMTGLVNPVAPDCPWITAIDDGEVGGVERGVLRVYNSTNYPLRIIAGQNGGNFVPWMHDTNPGGSSMPAGNILWFPGQLCTFVRQSPQLGDLWLPLITDAWNVSYTSNVAVPISAGGVIVSETTQIGTTRAGYGDYVTISGTYTANVQAPNVASWGAISTPWPWMDAATRFRQQTYHWLRPQGSLIVGAAFGQIAATLSAPAALNGLLVTVGPTAFSSTAAAPTLSGAGTCYCALSVPIRCEIVCANPLL